MGPSPVGDDLSATKCGRLSRIDGKAASLFGMATPEPRMDQSTSVEIHLASALAIHASAQSPQVVPRNVPYAAPYRLRGPFKWFARVPSRVVRGMSVER